MKPFNNGLTNTLATAGDQRDLAVLRVSHLSNLLLR
ncbi:hypothetical protein NB231_02278 [Nitrococcus mobilis Nb-231]|uniref:Uncharacterized protein n=1 Tax=Nitrococcus mobilis Nb-231 TaxID=314278 RepID=A4BRI5_9GAMM|nr:hypothetical protein NB231_02278 [Nitrococcus mobilis Nb-231]